MSARGVRALSEQAVGISQAVMQSLGVQQSSREQTEKGVKRTRCDSTPT